MASGQEITPAEELLARQGIADMQSRGGMAPAERIDVRQGSVPGILFSILFALTVPVGVPDMASRGERSMSINTTESEQNVVPSEHVESESEPELHELPLAVRGSSWNCFQRFNTRGFSTKSIYIYITV
jgi:hypothetical protein